jgi:hypothetical protein
MTNRDINGHSSGQHSSTCSQIHDLLPAYVTAEALGQQPQAVDPDVAAHIALCPHCHAELAELRELTFAAYTGRIEPASSYPQPDLSYLPTPGALPSANQQPWRLDELGRLIISFSQALLDSLRPPSLIGAARGQLLYSYAFEPRVLPNLQVSIDILAEDSTRGLGFVRVNVEALNHDPFEQTPRSIVLRTDEQTWQDYTDATGCVAFNAVPLAALPRLSIEITPEPAIDDQAAHGR